MLGGKLQDAFQFYKVRLKRAMAGSITYVLYISILQSSIKTGTGGTVGQGQADFNSTKFD